MQVLEDWDLEDAASALAKNGFKTRKKLLMMEEEDIIGMGLSRGDVRALTRLLRSLQAGREVIFMVVVTVEVCAGQL